MSSFYLIINFSCRKLHETNFLLQFLNNIMLKTFLSVKKDQVIKCTLKAYASHNKDFGKKEGKNEVG